MTLIARIGSLEIGAAQPRIVANVSRLQCAELAVQQGAELIEVRCDLVKPNTVNAILERIDQIAKLGLSLIGTIRKTIDGGDWHFKGDESLRYSLFEAVVPHVQCVDIEHRSTIRGDIIRLARARGVKVILSHHSFTHTPVQARIQALLQEMQSQHPDIIKLACMVRDQDEYMTLFRVLRDYVGASGERIPVAVIPMGPHGRDGRHAFPWFGSCLTYGCVSEEKGPSQPFVRELVETRELAARRTRFPIMDDEVGIEVLRGIISDHPASA